MAKADNSTNWKSILIAVIALVIELIVLEYNFGKGFKLYDFFIPHTIIMLFLTLRVYIAYHKEEDLRYPLLLWTAAFGGGPFGLGGFICFALLVPIFSRFSISAKVWFEELFPEHKLTPFTKIFQRVKSGWDDYTQTAEVTSFQDLFNYGTLEQKQNVLDAIVKDFNPEYSNIIRRALEDPHNSVRIQAAAIVSKIDFDFQENISKLLARYEEIPDDQENILRLADYYEAYSTSGILDSVRRNETANYAIKFYRLYLENHPDERNVLFAIGQLLFYSENYAEFVEWCHLYKSKYRQLSSITQAWYLESLYKLNRREELVEAAREF